MPTVTQIEAEIAITALRATRLKGAVRASAVYGLDPALYSDVGDLIDALVDVTTPSEDVIKSQYLSAIVTALDALGDGTVGVKGGPKGVDYSKARDRESLIAEALGLLYDAAFVSVLADGTGGNYAAQVMNDPACFCRRCSCLPCRCGSITIVSSPYWP